jgi:hypothetical protein
MDKKNMFEELNTGEYIWGNAYLYSQTGAVQRFIERRGNLTVHQICNLALQIRKI